MRPDGRGRAGGAGTAGGEPASGHRLRPHTADLVVEAWAGDRGGCLREAVRGLVAAFADVHAASPADEVAFAVGGDDDGERLVALLEEVLYRLDADDVVPVDVTFDELGARLVGRFHVVPTSAVAQRGAVPKAVARHDLVFGEHAGRWRCLVTVDV